MFTLGYSFRPWDGQKTIADGASILQYIKDTATEGGIDANIRFTSRVVSADWHSDDSRWHLGVERTDTGERSEVTCSFVFSCSGYYRYDHGYQPAFKDLDRFAGTVIHPQAWPEDLDYAGKRIVVIGSGATAVTLIPSLAEKAAHVVMLQRSPSYVLSLPASTPLPQILRRVLPGRLGGKTVRWVNALVTQGFYQLSRRRPGLVKTVLRRGIERQLPKGYDIATHFTPSYNPWDQRMCVVPNGDLFKAIAGGRASVVTDHIDAFTEKGIRLVSGQELEADIVVTATGLEVLFLGGVAVSLDGQPVDPASRMVYKGMMLEGVPNLAVAVGYTNASWTLKCDLTCDYVCRLLNHMHETGDLQCTPVNHDPAVIASPFMTLSSGYIQRAVDRFPKQGSRYPWQVKQSYLSDYRALKLSGIEDDAMEFSPGAKTPAGVGH
jgi:cation diffusion facilitator CzcD-associated flavoprotein CzcO